MKSSKKKTERQTNFKTFNAHFGGFSIKFKNGTQLSSQFFPCSYSENHNAVEDMMKFRQVTMFDYYHSDNVELAILDKDGEFITKEVLKLGPYEDTIKGYVGLDEWWKILHKCDDYDTMLGYRNWVNDKLEKIFNFFKKFKTKK